MESKIELTDHDSMLYHQTLDHFVTIESSLVLADVTMIEMQNDQIKIANVNELAEEELSE